MRRDRLDVLLDDAVDDFAHGARRAHAADNLPDGRADEVLRAVLVVAGVAMHAALRIGDEHELQRHRQRAGRVRAVPRLGPRACAAGAPACRSSTATAPCRVTSPRAASPGRRRCVSVSATVSQIEPVHTPCAPIASAAAICRPLPMPPAASTGARRDRIDRPRATAPSSDLAGVAARLGALGDDDVDAGLDLLLRVVRVAGERGDLHAAVVRLLDRRRPAAAPSAFASSRTGCASATSTCDRAVSCGPAEQAVAAAASSGSGGTPCSPAPSRRSRGAPGGSSPRAGSSVLGIARAPTRSTGRHDEVDAVRLAVDVLVDPRQLDLELLGREARARRARPCRRRG